MISLGPELAIDLSSMDAVPPQAGATAPGDGADADLFNAMLGQMMGQRHASLDGAASDAAEAAFDEDGADTAEAIDPAELVNPMMVEGVLPVIQAPVATMVWTIAAAPPAAIPETTFTGATLDLNAFAAGGSPTGMPSPADLSPSSTPSPLGEFPVADSQPASGDEIAVMQPLPTRSADAAAPLPETAAASAPKSAAVSDSATIPESAPVSEAATVSAAAPNTRSEFAPQIANAINQPDRSLRATKQDKAPAEPKLDAAALRPTPMAVVERAYAGNEHNASNTFDAPKDQAPSSSPATSQASATPAFPGFAVPVDGRPVLNPPLTTPIVTVDASASIARDIDTHVPSQIVHSIRLQANNGGGEAIIRLNPDYLGEVVVAVKVEQGSVTASLQAETPAVRQWAERNESVLRQALAEQGLQLDRLTVTEKAAEAESESRHEGAHEEAREEHSQQQPRRRRPQSDEATFEVTV